MSVGHTHSGLARIPRLIAVGLSVIACGSPLPTITPAPSPTVAIETPRASSTTGSNSGADATVSPEPTAPRPSVQPSPTAGATPVGPDIVWEPIGALPRSLPTDDLYYRPIIGSDAGFALADGDGGIWLSGDGIEWSKARLPGSRVRAYSVAPGSTGLAAGFTNYTRHGGADPQYDGVDPRRSRGAIWLNAAGDRWRLIDLGRGVVVDDVGVGQGKYVAGGSVDCSAAVWLSDNGADWGPARFVVDGCQSVERVAATESGYVAFTWSYDYPHDFPRAWYSPDGVTWTNQPTPENTGWKALATLGNVAVVTCGFESMWVNNGGITWQEADSTQEALRGVEISALTTWHGLFVGSPLYWNAAAEPRLVTSADGLEWARGQLPETAGDELVVAIAASGDLLLVFGSLGTVWRGSIRP